MFKIISSGNRSVLLDPRQEESSNWMTFVRPAANKIEQNLVAFQYQGEIYFATIKVLYQI